MVNRLVGSLPRRHLDIALLIIAAPLLSAGLDGCATPKPLETGPTSEAPTPISESHVALRHTVHYAPTAGAPNAAETAALNGFLASAGAAIGDLVVIERPVATQAVTIDDNRASRLAAALARQGLKTVLAPAAVGAGAGEMTVVIDRYIAVAPPCPNWSKAPGNDFNNTLHSDFGCSTATNLAAMIDDPRDLVQGREMGGVVGDPALAAIHHYRGGKGDSHSDAGAGAAQSGIAQSFTIAPAPPAETTAQ